MYENLVKYMAISLGASMCVYRGSIALGNIFCAISLLLFGYLLYKNFKRKVSWSELIPKNILITQKMLILMIVAMIPSVVFSYDIQNSTKEFFEIWIYYPTFFFISTVFIRDKNIAMKMLLSFLVVECAECVYVIYDALNGVYQPTGFGENVLRLASILIMIFPILIVLFSDSSFNKRLRFYCGIMLGFVLAGVIAIKSRAAWLSSLVVAPIVSFKYILANKKSIILALIVLVFVGGIFVVSPTMSGRFKSITNLTTNRSNIDRILLWQCSVDMLKDHPYTGVGIGCFKEVYQSKYEKIYKDEKIRSGLTTAHSNIFQVCSETGIFGSVGFLVFTVFMLWNSFKGWLGTKNPYALMLFGMWLSFTLYGVFDYTIGSSMAAKALWYLTGLLVVLKNEVDEAKIVNR